MSKPTQKDIDRFWSKVDKRSKSECWEWIGAKTRGYGYFSYKNVRRRVHRFVWFLTHGIWPKNNICHDCDNTSCVNPSHLFEGTQKENIQDCIKKGRSTTFKSGINHVNAKLTLSDISYIRQNYIVYHRRFGTRALARKFNISHTTISKIIRNKQWQNL